MTILSQLRTRLGRGESLTLRKIHESFSISERQARRYIDRLKAEGVPVAYRWESRHKVFFLSEQYLEAQVGPIVFTEEESLALAAASMAIDAVLGTTPLARPARTALQRLLDRLTDKILSVELSEQPRRWYIQAIAQTNMDPEVFNTVVQSLAHDQRLRIAYAKPREEATERWVDPLCIWIRQQAVFLTARQHYPRSLPAIKHYSLARIRSAERCPEVYFDRPDDFDPEIFYRADMQGAVTKGELQTFRVLASPMVAHSFKEHRHMSFQQIEEEREDGSLIVSWEGAGFEEWRSFFQSWGTSITVLEPETMRRRLAEEARELAARYGGA